MSDQRPVTISTGLPETVLPAPPPVAASRLAAAVAVEDVDERRAALQAVAADHPRFVDAWAALSEVGRDDIETYAYCRVGYHRGLDALRAAGWRGSGYVRWSRPTNRGFLQALSGLGRQAERIHETDEAERIATFLLQLDPEWDRKTGS